MDDETHDDLYDQQAAPFAMDDETHKDLYDQQAAPKQAPGPAPGMRRKAALPHGTNPSVVVPRQVLERKLAQKVGDEAARRAENGHQMNGEEKKTGPARAPKGALQPSLDQRQIIEDFRAGKNVHIIAVAGAGKTTTLKMCAAACPEKKCILLTYNKELQRETEQRVAAEGIKNLTVYTVHGAASRTYEHGPIYDDRKFIDAVRGGPPTRPEVLKCDALFIDEAQDMAIHYYIFIRHFINPEGGARQIVIVGDPRQAINFHIGARVEFLTKVRELFVNGLEWSSRTLRTSPRLTPATAAFVNAHVLGEDVLIGGNTRDPNLPPRYVVTKYHKAAETMWAVIQEAVKTYGVSNVALIAPSVRSIKHNPKNPLAQLVRNYMTGWALFVASRDDEVVRNEDIVNKFAIMTWNSMKGRERDCVIVVNFDETYFKYFMHDGWDSPGVPNVMYVAATRNRKELIIIADEKSTLRTINVGTLPRYVQPLRRPVARSRALRPSAPPDKLGVLDLLRHLDSVTIYEMANLVEVVSRERVARPEVDAKTTVEFETKEGKGYAESVAHLYGIVIPRIAELHLRNATDFGHDIYCPQVFDTEKEAARYEGALTRAAYNSYPRGFWDAVQQAAETDPAERTFVQWFQLAVAQNAIQDGDHHIARQILHYDWVNEPFVDSCVVCVDQVMENVVGAAAGDFEVSASATVDLNGGYQYEGAKRVGKAAPYPHEKKTIVGYLDFVERETDIIWEFKCTKGIQTNHLLQLACYLAMTGKQTGRLYAILSGEIETVRVKDGPGLLRLALSKYRKKIDGDVHEDIAKFMEKFEIPNAVGGEEDEISPLFENALTLDDLY